MKLMESPFYGKPCSTRRDTARAQADGLISGPRSVAPARIFGVVSLGMTAGRNRRVMLAVEAVIDQAAGGAVVRMPLLCTKRLQFTAHDLLDLPTGAIVAHPTTSASTTRPCPVVTRPLAPAAIPTQVPVHWLHPNRGG